MLAAYSYDNKRQIDIAILDFAKAFDTVPHEKLLSKINHYGIRGNTHRWISSFLIGRSQSVVVEGDKSAPVPVTSGVPQGTVLGPLLFLLHINDLPDHVKSQVRLFADDCLLYRTIASKEDQQILQQDLTSLEQWGVRWGMRFNASKCEIMRICRSPNPYTQMYSLGGEVLREAEQAKYLGINISNELSWSPHISSIASKANAKVSFLRRNLRHCPQELKEQAYIALVRSVLEYSSAVWDPYLRKDVSSLERVQRRAARFVSGDEERTSSVTTMLKELGWDSLEVRRQNIRLALLAKILSGRAAVSTDSILIEADSRTRANHPFKFRVIPTKTRQYQNSFFPRTVPQWNSLSSEEVQLLMAAPPAPCGQGPTPDRS